jgi:hypothetical protein
MQKNMLFALVASLFMNDAPLANRFLASRQLRVRPTGQPSAASVARQAKRGVRNLRNAERGGYGANWLAA